MKKSLFSSLYSSLFALLFTFCSVMGWGQVTVTYDFALTNAESGLDADPPIVLDSNIGFSSYKNKGTSNPVILSKQLRLYQNSTKGGSIKIYAQNGVTITKVVIDKPATGNGNGLTGYSVDSTEEQGTFLQGSGTVTIDVSATNYVEFYNKGNSGTTRTYLNSFTVTYTMPQSGKTVTFKGNGADSGGAGGTGGDYTQSASSETPLTPNTFGRTGYSFTNWHTTSSGAGGTSYTEGQSYDFSADLSLNAQWSINSYNIIYNGNSNDGGSAPNTQNAQYGNSVNLAANSGLLTRTGFAFNGWNTAANGSGTHYNVNQSFTIPANDTTLYAEWVSTTPTITTSGTLTALSTTYGTASSNTTFTVSASNLTNPLIITPPSGFEVSLDDTNYSASLNLGSGAITNTTIYVRLAATTDVGGYSGNITCVSSPATTQNVATAFSTVSTKALTITGISANNKIYDASTSATLNTTSAVLNGVINSDDVSLSGAPTGTFDTKNIGANKTVTIVGYTLSGTKAGNYSLTQPTTTGDIIVKNITVTGLSANNKIYDTTTTATFTGGVLSGLISGDVVSLTSITGVFSDANAAIGKAVTVSAISLDGTDGGNYTVTPLPTGLTADITKANPSFTTSTIAITAGDIYTLPGSNIDTDSNGELSYSITNGGYATLSGTTISAVSDGVETLTVNQAESTNYNAGSTTVQINVSTYKIGDYRTIGSGNWVSNNSTPAIWQRFNGTGWTGSNSPNYSTSNNVYIEVGHSITATGAFANSVNLFIKGNFTVSSSSTAASIKVFEGGKLILNGNTTNNGDFIVEDNAEVYLNSRANNIWNGDEYFSANSKFIVGYGYLSELLFATEGTIKTNEATGAKFGYLELKATSFAGGNNNWTNILPNGDYQLTKNDFTIENSSNKNFTLNGGSFVVGKDFIVNTTSSGDIATRSSVGTQTIDVFGNFVKNGSGSGRFRTNGSGISTIDITGNLYLNDGIFSNLGASSSATTSTINLKGNLYVNSDAIFTSNNTNSNFVKNAILNFCGNGDQQTIDVKNPSTMLYQTINVNSGAYVKLVNQDFTLGNSSSLNVKSGGTLDFGFKSETDNTALNITNHVNSATFNAEAESELIITSPEGLTNSTGTSSGNVQTMSTGRVFNPRAIYHYKGRANQVTGNGLPSGITGRVIVDLQTDETNENLTFNSSGTTSFGTTNEINGVLEIRRGKVIDAPSSGFRNYSGTIDDDNDGENDPQRGDLVMTGGRYVVSGGGTKPALSGTYTLTGGTVEFAGSGNTRIRVKPLYNSIAISGSNIVAGGKNLEVNNITKILQDGKLTIPETLDSESSYVLTSKKGLLNEAGVLLFGSGAQLMQDSDAINEGEISMLRKTKMQKMDYTYWSSPVVGQSLSTFSVGTPWNRRYEYREQDDLFTPTLDSHFQPAKGYAIRGKDAWDTTTEDVFAFSGIPINASTYSQNGGEVDLVRQIQKSKNTFINGEEYEHGYNLIGNPYPSNLSFYQFLDKPVNGLKNADIIHPKAWLWTNASPQLYMEGSTYNGNNYAIISYAGGVSPTYQAPSDGVNPFTQYLPTSSIKVGQGFIVQMKGNPPTGDIPNTATLRFSNDMRDTLPGVFYNNVGLARSQSIDRYWLQLKSPSNIYNTLLIAHTENATDDYDQDYDAELFSIGQDSFYTEVDAFKLQIDARPLFQSSQIIPLSTQYSEDGIYTIVLQKPEGVFESLQDIYLRDKLLDVVVNLKVKGYNFLTNAGIVQGRFEIVYEPKNTLGLFENYNNAVGVIRDGENFIIQSSDIIHDVEIYDASGRLMQKVEANKKQVLIDGSLLNTGVYFLKMYSNSGSVFKKVRK